MEREKLHLATLAALFHDIGKFYQRTLEKPRERKHAELSAEFLEEAKFLGKEKGKKVAVREKIKRLFGLEDREFELLKEAVRRHHDRELEKEENQLPFVIQKADWLSSGLDWGSIDQESFFQAETPEDEELYKPLISPFSLINVKESGYDNSARCEYNVEKLSVKSVFPVLRANKKGRRDYEELWNSFLTEFENLPESGDFNFKFEALKALFLKYMWCVPSYTYTKEKVLLPDISLAHHLLTTAAIATALWRYEKSESDTSESKEEKFLFLSIDFSGIQNFIFSPPKDTKKWAAKILRARSFIISLAIETVVRELLEEFEVNASSVIMNSGGKAWLILPNLSEAEKRIERVREKILDRLLSRGSNPSEKKNFNFFGEIKLKISWVKLRESDFNFGKFNEVLEKLAEEETKNRFRLFTTKDFGKLVIDGYAQEFSRLNRSVCSICGKAPACEDPNEPGVYKCDLCRHLIEIGTQLPKSEGVLITYRGKYFPLPKVELLKKEEIEEALGRMGDGQMLYSFSLNSGIPLPAKPLENYIPKVSEDELIGELRELIFECYEEEKPGVKEGIPKNFCHIALDSLEKRGDCLCGKPYLGVLKADVDNLGYIFSKGFVRKDGKSILSISRVVSLSWFLDFFFSEVIKSYIEDKIGEFGGRFRSIYSVFSGGDDLFLIGPWNRIFEFESVLRMKFEDYTCKNKSFTISAGISVVKPDLPIYYIADEVEEALETSKRGGKNTTTVFSKRVKYPDFSLKELLEKADWLTEEVGGWCDGEGGSEDKKKSGSFLYRLLTISEMANREGESPRNMLWRAYLKYLVYRNFGDREERARELFKELEELIRRYSEDISEKKKDKDKGKDNLFYIPLAIALYRRRKYGKGER